MQAKSDSFVAYYRVSADRQGRSGLRAGRPAGGYAPSLGERWRITCGSVVEVESRKRNNRPGTAKGAGGLPAV